MVIRNENNMLRVTVTLEPIDVDLLDRLAVLEGANRSAELRSIMVQLRPTLIATVEAFEAASKQRELFDRTAAQATISELEALLPEVEQLHKAYLGAMSRIEGHQAAGEAQDPRSVTRGSTPPNLPTPDENENGVS